MKGDVTSQECVYLAKILANNSDTSSKMVFGVSRPVNVQFWVIVEELQCLLYILITLCRTISSTSIDVIGIMSASDTSKH